MNCQELAQKIETLQPGAETKAVARLCLLLAKLLYWLFDSAGLVHKRERQGSTTLSQV